MKKLCVQLFIGLCFFSCSYARKEQAKHFILGFTPETSKTRLTRVLKSADGRMWHALFSPDEDLRQLLIDLIDNEHESIKLAVYFLTDKTIVEALVRAQRRGVQVMCITDQQCANSRYGKARLLKKYGVPVAVYDDTSGNGHYKSLMHHKFVVFGKNFVHRPLVWTGSFNFTRSARMRNQENAIISDDDYLVQRFNRQFKKLLARATTGNKHVTKHAPKKRKRWGFKKALRNMKRDVRQKS